MPGAKRIAIEGKRNWEMKERKEKLVRLPRFPRTKQFSLKTKLSHSGFSLEINFSERKTELARGLMLHKRQAQRQMANEL